MKRNFQDERLDKLWKAANEKIGQTDKEMIRDYFLEEEEVSDTWMEFSDQFIETGEQPMEPFSIKEELKSMHFDKHGNLIPNLEEEEDGDFITESDENLITEDRDIALDSLRLLIQASKGKETVSDLITYYFKKDMIEEGNQLTDAACNLMFMGFSGIYNMNEKQMGKVYQRIFNEMN